MRASEFGAPGRGSARAHKKIGALWLLALVPTTAHAEVAAKGIRAGLAVTELSNQQPNDNATNADPGFLVGSYLRFALSSAVAIQPEVAISNLHAFQEHCSPCMTLDKFSFWYAELPVLLRFDVSPDSAVKLHFDGGPELVLAMGATDSGRTVTHLQPATVGVLAGAGLDIDAGPGGITFDVRYQRWAGHVIDDGMTTTFKTGNQLIATVGYVFP